MFVEGREDIECIKDCGGGMQEERHVEEEESVEKGVASRRKALLWNNQTPTKPSATNAWQRSRNDSNYD